MIKSLLRMAIFAAAQHWLTGRAGPPSRAPSPIHANVAEIKHYAIRYASLVTLVFLNFLLFVGALVVSLVAIAHSHDVFGEFRATNVFWTGIVMGLTALVLAGLSAWALAGTKPRFRDLVVTEPVVEDAEGFAERFFRPIYEGVAEGLRSPRREHREKYPAA